MKKLFLLFIVFTFVSCEIQKVPQNQLNTLIPVILYETSTDFINKKPQDAHVGILITEESSQHITIEGIFDLETGQRIVDGNSMWALNYKNNNYFNLGYSSDLNHWKSYAKFDIEGKYCAIIIDENSPYVLTTTGSNYGGGLTGLLIAESQKWGKNWKDKNGVKKKILFIDTEDISSGMFDRNRSSLGNYLTRKQFEKLLNKSGITLNDSNIKNVSFERVIEVIKEANKK
ncbi:hypothetical protein KRX57_00155 [Weeksellaceae bacterium TAE3-ERU29]|nr:hypothetical protein [Weeksellaceae bacterium TAE3-ERU29]